MENKVLTDPLVKPENVVLENVLGKNFALYNEFVERIFSNDLILEWNYYNDEKSWLCKILNKRKTFAGSLYGIQDLN